MDERSRLSIRDGLAEAFAGLLQRPSRSLLTMLGTVLGIGAFVAILGLTSTASNQIDRRFDLLAATEVVVRDAGSPDPQDKSPSFPPDAAERIMHLNGVRSAGVFWPVPFRSPSITANPGMLPLISDITVLAADASALAAARPSMRVGRLYDAFHATRRERVAVLGTTAAARLGVTRLDSYPAVFIDGIPYTVLGVVDDVQRKPELLQSIMIPAETALDAYGPPVEQRAEMLIETSVGAAPLIASQAALALRPDAPERFEVIPPPDPKTLRGTVTGDLDALFLVLAGISLVVGSVGIANTTLVAVMERTNEIGLRRAVGARPMHIAAQFLIESSTLGLLGGLVGSSVGVVVVISTALIKDWTAVMAPWTVITAPAVGLLVGVVAGIYPSLRAARVEPVVALAR